jgi:hypothetical protein
MPPPPNQREVARSTKPPNEDAYGLGRRTASITKSAALAPSEEVRQVMYFALARSSLRRISVTRPIPSPRSKRRVPIGLGFVIPWSAPTNL